jgi:hypothetical protein
MLFYILHKYYFNKSGTRTVHITSFQYHKLSDASVQRRGQPCCRSTQENTKGFGMTFNGVRKWSSFMEVGQLAKKLKWDTHKYIMMFTGTARKISSHFEYLENRSRGLDVTWHSEETLLCIREQSLSRGASQSAVRRHWLSLCTVWPSHSQISSLSTAISALGKARSRREPNLGCRELRDVGDVMICPPPHPKKKNLHESCRMGRRLAVMKLICSLGHCECDGHRAHTPSQRRLTADWPAPRQIYCSWKDSKFSSDWLPSYIKDTRPVLEIFKMVGYFPDSPRTWCIVFGLFHRLQQTYWLRQHQSVQSHPANGSSAFLQTVGANKR